MSNALGDRNFADDIKTKNVLTLLGFVLFLLDVFSHFWIA